MLITWRWLNVIYTLYDKTEVYLPVDNKKNCLVLQFNSSGWAFDYMMTVLNTVDCLDIHSLLNNGSVSKLQTPFTTQRNRAKSFMENSAMARLRLLRGLGPADPQNILKRDTWVLKTENGLSCAHNSGCAHNFGWLGYSQQLYFSLALVNQKKTGRLLLFILYSQARCVWLTGELLQ